MVYLVDRLDRINQTPRDDRIDQPFRIVFGEAFTRSSIEYLFRKLDEYTTLVSFTAPIFRYVPYSVKERYSESKSAGLDSDWFSETFNNLTVILRYDGNHFIMCEIVNAPASNFWIKTS